MLNSFIPVNPYSGIIRRLIALVSVQLTFLNWIIAAGPGNPENNESIYRLWNGKIYQITLRGESYPFDHADYGVFIPDGVTRIRGLLIHQHGCGMERFGVTIPYDIQYQAFAKKWDLAVIEPVLYGNCGLWRDPESGSGPALLEALNKIGKLSGHTELNYVPWLLWGHSGGGYWTLAMMKNYPERILAVFSYSPAFNPQWEFPPEAAKIPLLIRHAGSSDCKLNGGDCWETALNVFNKLRKMNAPVSIAYNSGQNHNFSYVRYMAIPFYEAALAQRLSDSASSVMRCLDNTKAWLGDTATFRIYKVSRFIGSKESLCWLPDSMSAVKWKEFVTTGSVGDQTPPPAPYDLHIKWKKESIQVTWKADADIESGIKYFNIYQDGIYIDRFPKSGTYQTFDTNGDNAVPKLLPEMKCRIEVLRRNKNIISIRTVNHFDLESEDAKIECRPRHHNIKSNNVMAIW
jgi:pimeloyl-ACP methyl ester carboxylesterase